MSCKMCKMRKQTWAGDPPKCAFENGEEFQPNNWNCATMNALREIADDILKENYYIEDTHCAIIPYDGDTNAGFIVLSWYKRRGNTGTAILVYDDSEPVPITESMALEAIAYYKELEK